MSAGLIASVLATVLVGLVTNRCLAAETFINKTANAQSAEPVWAVDPNIAEDSLPPVGRSLFDYLVVRRKGDKYVYDVPFPFTALTGQIEANLQQNDGGTSPLKQVLIPLGRSLQRTAAAPEFFKYPRAVTAVDTEAKAGGTSAGMLLKDRLYLGYQEKADLIEVISYNEAAGRFEFQLVKDYRRGGKPQVLYANRAICLSCHQNGAPIFSRQIWDETNANPKIAALLHRQRRDFYGIDVDRGIDVPYAIDNAAGRANLLAAYQRLWREGCGFDEAEAVRCRAFLFIALLQYKLSGNRQFDQAAEQYRDHVAARIAANGRRRWPSGLAIGNPDIPNRDPLPGEPGLDLPDSLLAAITAKNDDASTQRLLANLSNVTAVFEPLNPRLPLEIWSISQPEHAVRAVIGLAEFIAEADVAALDTHLAGRSRREHAAYQAYSANCKIARKMIAAGRQRVDFACASAPTSRQEKSVALTGSVRMEGIRILDGTLDNMQLNGQGELRDMALLAFADGTPRAGRKAVLRLLRNGKRVRNADGDAVERVELTFSPEGKAQTGSAVVIMREDFAPIKRAVIAMADDAIAGRFDGFSAKPFRRASLMPALFARLGMQSAEWCCLEKPGMPAASLQLFEKPVVTAGKTADPYAAALEPFYRHCATCHQTTDHFPPNFLVGTSERVRANLAQCAERLFVRLSMWQLAPEIRSKSPMPPVNALRGTGYSPEAWPKSAELAGLVRYAENILKKQTGSSPRLDEMVGRGYENLRTCLPIMQ